MEKFCLFCQVLKIKLFVWCQAGSKFVTIMMVMLKQLHTIQPLYMYYDLAILGQQPGFWEDQMIRVVTKKVNTQFLQNSRNEDWRFIQISYFMMTEYWRNPWKVNFGWLAYTRLPTVSRVHTDHTSLKLTVLSHLDKVKKLLYSFIPKNCIISKKLLT